MVRTFKLAVRYVLLNLDRKVQCLRMQKKLPKTHVHTTTFMETEVACRRILVSIITVFLFDFHVKNYDDDTKQKWQVIHLC